MYAIFAAGNMTKRRGYPEGGIAPGTEWDDVPDDFECPMCLVGKDQFSGA